MRLQEPQAVLTPLTAAALFLVATIDADGEAVGRDLLSDLAGLERTVGFREPTAGLGDPDGTERQILRDNMAFGTIGAREFGTYFIGYASTPAVTEQMLRNMFIGNPPGNHDRILDFSTAVTGSLFFVPTADFLDDLPPAPGQQETTSPSTSASTDTADADNSARNSLGIGGVRDDHA